MFLPVEQAGEVIIQGDDSDTVEDLEVDNAEENVEKCLPETEKSSLNTQEWRKWMWMQNK